MIKFFNAQRILNILGFFKRVTLSF